MTDDQARQARHERRALAREKARRIREEHRKKERLNRVLVQGGLIVATLTILAVVALVIINSVRPPSPGPLNMLSDGILIQEGLTATRTAALEPGADPVPTPPDDSPDVLQIRIWVDYLCPYCRQFEEANRAQLEELLGEGHVTVEIHPIAMLDHRSAGTKYSTRAANAAACVANWAPDQFWAFHGLLFENQPAEGEPGLHDDQLVELANRARADKASTVERCIRGQTFRNWVSQATDRALNRPVPNSELEKVPAVPLVLVDGRQYRYTLTEDGRFDPDEFSRFLIEVLGTQFTEEPTPSPSPSPSPST